MTDMQTHGSNLASVPFPKQYAKSRAMFFQESENSFCPIGCGMDEIAMHHLAAPLFLHRTSVHSTDGCPTKIQLHQFN
eukprot:scaffold10260_cov266-Chaetoceros_neogracile.AAC.48